MYCGNPVVSILSPGIKASGLYSYYEQGPLVSLLSIWIVTGHILVDRRIQESRLSLSSSIHHSKGVGSLFTSLLFLNSNKEI